MIRLLDILQAAFYVAAIGLLVLLGVHATTVLKEMSASLKQDRIYHDQQLKDHQQQLKDHERAMERR